MGLSLQTILLIRVPMQEQEASGAERRSREEESWQRNWALKLGNYSRPASRLSNSAFSPPPLLIERPDSDEYTSNPSRSGSSMESSLAGSRPGSAKRPPVDAARGPPRPVSAGSRRQMYCFYCGQRRQDDRLSDCPGRLYCCYWFVDLWVQFFAMECVCHSVCFSLSLSLAVCVGDSSVYVCVYVYVCDSVSHSPSLPPSPTCS